MSDIFVPEPDPRIPVPRGPGRGPVEPRLRESIVRRVVFVAHRPIMELADLLQTKSPHFTIEEGEVGHVVTADLALPLQDVMTIVEELGGFVTMIDVHRRGERRVL